MTYGDGQYLHDYLGFSNTETELLLGEQKLAVKDLYAELVHTSSTHAGFETGIPPWGDRDFGDNLSPHGWYAARLRIALRNILVREQGTDLHLLSAISPEWVGKGSKIEVDRAPTNFGVVNFRLQSVSAHHAELTFNSLFVNAPKRIILHLPWFMQTETVTVGGKRLPIANNQVVLPPTVKTVSIDWTKRADAESMSYLHAVADYKAQYAARYQEFLRTGNQ